MKTHDERMHELLYDCEGIVEKSERICKLEEENAKLREQYETVLADYRSEVAKLREFASEAYSMAFNFYHGAGTAEDLRELKIEYHELIIEAES